LISSIPSRLTLISSLLLAAQRGESEVLQPHDLGLDQAQVDQRPPAVVLALDVVHARTSDLEDRHAPPIRAAHKGAHQLAAARKSQGTQEEVIRLKHRSSSPVNGSTGITA
jgi:hypothetical protein